MRRIPCILIAFILVLHVVLAKDVKQVQVIEKPVEHQPEEIHSEKQDIEKQISEDHASKKQELSIQHSESQLSEVHHSEEQHSKSNDSEEQNSEYHHSESQPTVASHSDAHHSKKQMPTGRQFHPLPPYHPMLFQPPSGFEAIRRQFGGGLGSDLVMVGLISLPIIGLLTMGSASLGNLLGLGLSSSSSSKKSSSKRTKRSLKEKAADAVEYAKNLWNVMEQLEKAFEKYDLYQAECRLRVVCEAHHKDRRMGTWGQSILDLMRQQKELEGRELLPVSRFLFSNYAEAAQAGVRNENCAQLYTGCPRHLSYYLSAKEDQMENEVENGM